MSTFIIAEAGSSWQIGTKHARHLAFAEKCIRVAKACGADACKFQWTSAPGDMAARRHMPGLNAYQHLAWPQRWLPILAAACEDASIEFMCTVFVPQDVATIAPFVKRFKVASLEHGDEALLQAMAQVRITTQRGEIAYVPSPGTFIKPIYASVGAANSWDFRPAHSVLLHCVCAYPAPINQMNLGVLRPFRAGSACYISDYDGLSDHSGDVLTGALAVACGAEIIEVHFRLDETRRDNPDYAHSHPPASLKQYIANIRKAELMLGDGVKKVEACEQALVKHRVTA